MAAAPKVYNADEVTLSIGDTLIESGFADGEFLTFSESSPRITKVVGTNGEVVVGRHGDPSGEMVVKLLQTSDGNDVLHAMAEANRKGPGLPGVKPFFIRDRNGRAIHEGPACWVEEMPSATYDRSATTREWKLGCVVEANDIRGSDNLG